MTLDNCIKRYEIWASDDRISPNIREEHKQIVKWLSSYKKLLEQEPCEYAISRQAVCNIVDDIRDCISVEGYWAILERLKKLQPFTPQPKTDVLGKIRDEIETKYGQCDICEYFENYDYEENDISEYRPIGNIADILQIIDKYKAESEARNDTNSTADL